MNLFNNRYIGSLLYEEMKKLPLPFVLEEWKGLKRHASFFEESLLFPLKTKEEFVTGDTLTNAIFQFLINQLYETKNFGGYGKLDGETVVDFYSDEPSAFDYSKLVADQFSNHIIVKGNNETVEAFERTVFGTSQEYRLKSKSGETGQSIGALITYILADALNTIPDNKYQETIKKHYLGLQSLFDAKENFGASEERIRALIMLESDIYALMALDVNHLTSTYEPIPNKYKALSNIEFLVEQDLEEATCERGTFIFNESDKSKGFKIPQVKIKTSNKVADLKPDYHIEVEWSDKAKQLIPTDCENITISEYAKRTLEAVKKTRDSKFPFWNICWYGPSGTGKSTEARAFAETIGFPYYPMAVSDNTYSDDLLKSKTVNTKKVNKQQFLKKFKEMVAQPNAGEKIYELVSQANQFTEEESPLFTAFVNGGVCELIEANALKPAQAKILNSMLDDTKKISINGEVYERNPNFILICTMNCDEGTEGVHQMSRDFVQRFHIGEYFDEITDAELKNRIMLKTELQNDGYIDRMINVYHSMQKAIYENGTSHDFVGLRQLLSWAQLTAMTNMPYQSGMQTMVNLATFDPEFASELKKALETDFTKGDDE